MMITNYINKRSSSAFDQKSLESLIHFSKSYQSIDTKKRTLNSVTFSVLGWLVFQSQTSIPPYTQRAEWVDAAGTEETGANKNIGRHRAATTKCAGHSKVTTLPSLSMQTLRAF